MLALKFRNSSPSLIQINLLRKLRNKILLLISSLAKFVSIQASSIESKLRVSVIQFKSSFKRNPKHLIIKPWVLS